MPYVFYDITVVVNDDLCLGEKMIGVKSLNKSVEMPLLPPL
jgi:hypothetical protein